MSLTGIDTWLSTNPADSDPSCTRGPRCDCAACREQRMLAEAAEQGVSPRMAMRRRRDEK